MVSSRRPNSARAVKARSADSRRKPKRKQIINPLRNPLIRKAADMLQGTHEQRAEAILQAAKVAEPARTARRQIDGVLAVPALREIRQQLALICSCVIVVHHALTAQSALLDNDAALVLKRHVSDALYEQVLRIDRLLGVPPGDDEEEGCS